MLEFIDNTLERPTGLAEKAAVTAAARGRTLLPLLAGLPASEERTRLLLLGPEFDDLRAEPLHGDAPFAFHRWCDFGRLAEPARTWLESRPGGQGLVYASRGALR